MLSISIDISFDISLVLFGGHCGGDCCVFRTILESVFTFLTGTFRYIKFFFGCELPQSKIYQYTSIFVYWYTCILFFNNERRWLEAFLSFWVNPSNVKIVKIDIRVRISRFNGYGCLSDSVSDRILSSWWGFLPCLCASVWCKIVSEGIRRTLIDFYRLRVTAHVLLSI